MLEEKPFINKHDYVVKDVDFTEGKKFIEAYHYAKGGSNTRVYMHGMFGKATGLLMGVAWWLPPTRVACESVNRAEWKRVISLTRLAVHPDAPRNSCSFLLAKSIAMIRKDGRFVSLVTYADEYMGHTGTIYRASNWQYVGKTGPYQRWEDCNGKQVAQKATVNRVKAKMESLGHKKVGSFYKHKYVLHLT